MSNLKYATTEELRAELERREKANIPEMIPNPDLTRLKEYLLYAQEFFEEHGREPKDFEHYVYEKVMEAFYGPSYWSWLNEVML